MALKVPFGASLKDGKNRLLRAADVCFRRGGYSDVGVAEILKTAELRPPTLYHHFKDKEDLYLRWLGEAFGKFGREVKQILQSEPDSFICLSKIVTKLAEKESLDIAQILRDQSAMDRVDSKQRITQLYMENLFEPVCHAMIGAGRMRLIAQDSVGKSANWLISSALAMNPRAGYPASTSSEDAMWLVQRVFKALS